MKFCGGCGLLRTKIFFNKNRSNKDGLQTRCKNCNKDYREKQDKTGIKKYIQAYNKENKVRLAQAKKDYRLKNSSYLNGKRKQNALLNRDKQRKSANLREKNRRNNDSLFKFSMNVRALVRSSFKRQKTKNFKKNTKTEQLLGCSIAELRAHLAKQFLPGMSLDNHGEWHIDHIVPLASASTQAEIEALCHYTNLQPLWAEDNFKKRDKI